MSSFRSFSLNNVQASGNITRDPELRYIPGGAAVCNFSIAISKKYKDRTGATQESTTYVDIKCWKGTAEFIGENAQKGDPVIIEGSLESESWVDKTSGQNRSKLVVQAQRVQLLTWTEKLSSGVGTPKRSTPVEPTPRPIEEPLPDDNDMPF